MRYIACASAHWPTRASGRIKSKLRATAQHRGVPSGRRRLSRTEPSTVNSSMDPRYYSSINKIQTIRRQYSYIKSYIMGESGH